MKWNILLIILFSLGFLHVPGFAGEAQNTGGTLIIGLNSDVISLDPARCSDNESARINTQIFETLVRYGDESTRIEPELATSWSLSENRKEWTFYLRKGIQFHDGTPFNAQAVVFSYQRQIDPGHPYYRNDFSVSHFVFKSVLSIIALDAHTVIITMNRPYIPFLKNLAMPFGAPIISPTAVKTWGNDYQNHPVGTGPFVFQERVPGDRIVLSKNPDYWKGPVKIGKLVFRILKNPGLRFREFRSGRIHVLDSISRADTKKIEQLPHGVLRYKPGLNIAYLAMNMEKKPFGDVRVRRAVNHAINKPDLIKHIFGNSAIPAKNPIPPSVFGYNDDIRDYEFNPKKARKLLNDAGLPNGFSTTLWVPPISRPYMPKPKKIARIIQGNLEAVGIKLHLVSHKWRDFVKKTKNGEHDLLLLGWIGENADPDNFLFVNFDKDNAIKPNAMNRSFFKNDLVHNMLTEAQETADVDRRITLYRNVQEIIHAQAPWVPLAHVRQNMAYQDNVHRLVLQPTGLIRFQGAWMEE